MMLILIVTLALTPLLVEGGTIATIGCTRCLEDEAWKEVENFRDCCPVNGGWTEFGDWSVCSDDCGGGSQSRERTCTSPEPRFGGDECVGVNMEEQKCNTVMCPIDGVWSDFEEWSECTAQCGGGAQTRMRWCNNPEPQFGGEECDGPETEDQECNTHECPINGEWSEFGQWTECSVECGGGVTSRLRWCTNPAPKYGGEECVGDDMEMMKCNTQECPIDGSWSDYGDWNECSAECGGGSQRRARTCTNPEPQFGGSDCQGENIEAQECNTAGCPVDGGWGDWSDWDECSVSCGGGVKSRRRSCSNPLPQNGGAECEGDEEGSEDCNTGGCPGYCDTDNSACYRGDIAYFALGLGEKLTSKNGKYDLNMENDGNLVVYCKESGTALWSTKTAGAVVNGGLKFEADQNLVLYEDGVAVWASHTAGSGGYKLHMQNDGNVVLYTEDLNPLWSTGTHTAEC